MDSAGPGRALQLIWKACELIRGLQKVNGKARQLGWECLQLIRECFGALLSGFGRVWDFLKDFRIP